MDRSKAQYLQNLDSAFTDLPQLGQIVSRVSLLSLILPLDPTVQGSITLPLLTERRVSPTKAIS